MIEALKKLFAKPSPAELEARELAEAERELLLALTAKDYAEAMCNYHAARINRLKMKGGAA